MARREHALNSGVCLITKVYGTCLYLSGMLTILTWVSIHRRLSITCDLVCMGPGYNINTKLLYLITP